MYTTPTNPLVCKVRVMVLYGDSDQTVTDTADTLPGSAEHVTRGNTDTAAAAGRCKASLASAAPTYRRR